MLPRVIVIALVIITACLTYFALYKLATLLL